MDNYKINYIYNEDKDINEILIKILNKELKKYIEMICKNEKCEVPLCMRFSLEDDKNC